MELFLKKGQRGLLLGMTGGGKTQNALFQLKNNIAVWPTIIMDTKIVDEFFSVPNDHESLDVFNDFASFENVSKMAPKDWPDYFLVRPESHEIIDVDGLDKYLQLIYKKFGAVFVYIDEVASFHNNGRPVSGLLELLCRGRSRGKTVLMGTQRPAWISLSCFTESDKFYVHKITTLNDRKRIDNGIPEFSKLKKLPPFHFYFYDVAADNPVSMVKPVPETKIDKTKISRRKWL